MSKKISTYVCVCEPDKMGFPIREAVKSYLSFSDEVIVIYGREEESSMNDLIRLSDKIKIYVTNQWPVDWHYDHMCTHLQLGLNKCTGDYAIKMDADCIFNDEYGDKIRESILDFNGHILNFNRYSYYYKKGFDRKEVHVLYCLNTTLLKKQNIEYFISNHSGSNLPMLNIHKSECSESDIVLGRVNNPKLCPINYDDTFLTMEQALEKWFYFNSACKKKNNYDEKSSKSRFANYTSIDDPKIKKDYINYKTKKSAACHYEFKISHPKVILEKFGLDKEGKLNLPKKYDKFIL